jgi:hypothetical protein
MTNVSAISSLQLACLVVNRYRVLIIAATAISTLTPHLLQEDDGVTNTHRRGEHEQRYRPLDWRHLGRLCDAPRDSLSRAMHITWSAGNEYPKAKEWFELVDISRDKGFPLLQVLDYRWHEDAPTPISSS